MRKILVIASREYLAAVRTKSFLIGLLILPLMMGGGIFIQVLLKDKVDVRDKHFALVDRTPGQQLEPIVEQALTQRNSHLINPETGKQTQPKLLVEMVPPSADNPEAIEQQRFELSERVRKGELFGFAEIGRDILEPKLDPRAQAPSLPPKNLEEAALASSPQVADRFALRYQSSQPTYDLFYRWLHHVVDGAARELRGIKAGLPPGKLTQVLMPVPLQTRGLSKQDAATGKIIEAPEENPVLGLLIPGGLLILMFMLILVGSTPLVQGVVEEKMQRIAEVLLGSVQPFQLMMGKLVGMAGVSLTLGACYLGGALWAAHHYEVLDRIPVHVIAWFMLFQTLAVIMYGSLFIAIGAACTDMRETQTLIWPVMLLACIPMFVWINVVREPTSSFAQGLSFFPFATPTIMVARLAVPPGIGWVQPALGVLVMLLTTTLCVYVAGRIFRVGILMQGKAAQLSELVRWVVRG